MKNLWLVSYNIPRVERTFYGPFTLETMAHQARDVIASHVRTSDGAPDSSVQVWPLVEFVSNEWDG